MAVTLGSTFNATQSKTSGTTLVITIGSLPIPARRTLILGITFDNLTGTTPSVTSITKPAAETNSWTLIRAVDSPTTSSGGGMRTELWGITLASQWQTTDPSAITVTLSAAVTSKSGAGLIAATASIGTAYGAGSLTSPVTSIVIPPGGMFVGFRAVEGASTVPATSSAPSGYADIGNLGTSGGSAATNVALAYGTASNTTTSDTTATYGMTYSGDGAVLGVVLEDNGAKLTQAAYRFYADGTETGSTALAAQDTAPAVDVSGGDVPISLRMRLQETNAIPVTATDDFQLQFEKNASGSWANVTADALGDSFTNQLSFGGLYGPTGTYWRRGQSFTGNGANLLRAQWFLGKTDNGAFSGGLIYCDVYAHTGAFGTSGVPTGSPLATSSTTYNPTSFTTVSVPFPAVDFAFDGSLFLTSGQRYVLVLRGDSITGGTTSSFINVGAGTASTDHSGNPSYWNGAWVFASSDLAFAIFTDNPPVAPYNSANLTDAAATTNRLTGGSGTFVAGKVSEDSLVDDLGWTASNYTELLYSLKLKSGVLVPTDTLRFRVLRNGTTVNLTYTQVPTLTIAGGTYTGTASLTGTGSITATGSVGGGVTNYNGSATLSGAGTITASGVVGRSATATLSGAGTITASGSTGTAQTSSLSGAGTITATGSVGKNTTASLSGTGSITATGALGQSQTATLSGAGAITASGVVGKSATATLSGAGTITASGAVDKTTTATLSVVGAITATGVVAVTGSATLSGVGSISASGTTSAPSFNGTATLSGVGGITAAGVVDRSASATLSGVGAITAAGSVGKSQTAALSGVGSITAAGSTGKSSTAALSGAGSITAAGVTAATTTATLAGAGTITASGFVGLTGTATLSGVGTISASFGSGVTSTATLFGAGSITASGATGKSTTASLSGVGSISASGTLALFGTATLTGVGSIMAGGGGATAGTATLSGSGTIVASGVVARSSGATLAGVGSITAAGVTSAASAASLSGAGSITAAGFVGRATTASLSGVGAITATGSAGSAQTTSLAGAGTIAATGVVGKNSVTSLSGAGTITAAGVVGRSASATLSGSATVTTAGVLGVRTTTTITAVGAITATGVVGLSGTATLLGVGSITAAGNVPPDGGYPEPPKNGTLRGFAPSHTLSAFSPDHTLRVTSPDHKLTGHSPEHTLVGLVP